MLITFWYTLSVYIKLANLAFDKKYIFHLNKSIKIIAQLFFYY